MAEKEISHSFLDFIRKIRRAFLILTFSLIIIHGYAQDYQFRHFNSNDGLPQPFIYSISQDSKGYLWVGTGSGLARFNGFEFENFTTLDSLAGDFISCSLNVGDQMWFGHTNGRLTRYDGKKFNPVNVPDQSPITGMVKDVNDNLWVSTYSDGLLKVETTTNSVFHYTFQDKFLIRCLGIINSSELLLGTANGLLHCHIRNNKAEVSIITDVPAVKISSIKKTATSYFLVATEEDGIYQIIPGVTAEVSPVITEPAVISGIQDVLLDHRNNLWISTFGNGIVNLSQTRSRSYSNAVYFKKENGFVTDNSKLIFEDREGCIWAGHFGEGMSQFVQQTFFTSHNEINVLSLYFNQQSQWIGTESGLFKTDRLSKIMVNYREKGLPADKINTLYSPDGIELWIGTENNGVFRLDMRTDKIRSHNLGEDALLNSINIITGKGTEVWLGTKKGLCGIDLKNKETTWYTLHQGGLPHNFVNTVFIDSKNKIWVGTRNSVLAVIEQNKVRKINLNPGDYRNFELSSITEDANSRIWVGSLGKGVFIIDDTDSIANLTTRDGLLSDFCYSIIYENTNIWIGHKAGLSRITDWFSIKAVAQINDNPKSYQFNANAVVKDTEQKIWFGTDKGLVIYDPASENQKLTPPVLSILSISINDEKVNPVNEIILPSGKYKIRIEYSGISLKQPAMVTYQYKLDGYEQWSEITKNTHVTYSHLSEGNYTFMLKASDSDGAITQTPLTFNLKIKKPVWKQWWFFPFTVLFAMILAFGYIKRREYRFSEEKKRLEEKVHKRTAEIQMQKTKIELQKNFIEEKNFQITSSITYASHIQNAVLPSTDLIQKLLPEYFLLNKPKDIVSGDFFWVAKKNNKIIFTVADCTGHGVPGAFMSLLGVTLLNEIVNIHGIINPPTILSRLRERIIESLQQNKGDKVMSDGMDMALCVLDRKAKKIWYSGAKQDLVLIRNGNKEVIRADRFSVNAEYDSYNEFSCKTVGIETGDLIYLFTDGYKDQFGGALDKKFMVRRFYRTLLDIHQLPMDQQKYELEKRISDWMMNNEQTDDIMVMGIRI